MDLGEVREGFRGEHITLDYKGFTLDPTEGGKKILMLMGEAAKKGGMKEVHRHIEVFESEGETPPGFASVVLVDESHISAHCYSDEGLLAIDIFTCGSHPADPVANIIIEELKSICPKAELVQRHNMARFPA